MIAFAHQDWRRRRTPRPMIAWSRPSRLATGAFAGAVLVVGAALLLAVQPRPPQRPTAAAFLRNTDPTGARLAVLRYAPMGAPVDRVVHAITASGGLCRTLDTARTSQTVCIAPPVVRAGTLSAQRIELQTVEERIAEVRVCAVQLTSSGNVDAHVARASCAATSPNRACEATVTSAAVMCGALSGVDVASMDVAWTALAGWKAVLRINGRSWIADR